MVVTELRPYQLRAVEWTEDTLPTLARPSVVVQAPTGAGKTVLMAALRPDVVIAPGVDLCAQLSSRVEGATVLTTQLAALMLRRGEDLPPARRVALDEARWVAAPGWGAIVDHYLQQGAELILFDATPTTTSGGGLGRWADALYQVATVRELVDAGYLVPWKVMAPDEPQRELAAEPVDAWHWQTPGESAIVFAENKAHAAGVVESFTRADVSAALITDDTSERQRAWILRALGDGSLTVAVCAQILRQGIDVPRVSSIILARACGSIPLYLQAVGRGGRPFEGKARCTVLDLRGTSRDPHIGHPEDPRIWALDGPAVSLPADLPACVMCEQCRAWGRGGRCQICGHALPPPGSPKVRAKDLIEVRAQTDGEEARRATLERFVQDAVRKGHKPWSAAHRYRGTYGAEPPREWMVDILRWLQQGPAQRTLLDI
ncbi:MAG: hypothetical protein EKK62_12895 [Acidimicrobiia bacterium]|nr:MAG: hypothetical protein EKK62_12895 [Acidimicrobiia bacterium]